MIKQFIPILSYDPPRSLAGVGLPHESADFLQGLVYLTLSAVVGLCKCEALPLKLAHNGNYIADHVC